MYFGIKRLSLTTMGSQTSIPSQVQEEKSTEGETNYTTREKYLMVTSP